MTQETSVFDSYVSEKSSKDILNLIGEFVADQDMSDLAKMRMINTFSFTWLSLNDNSRQRKTVDDGEWGMIQ